MSLEEKELESNSGDKEKVEGDSAGEAQKPVHTPASVRLAKLFGVTDAQLAELTPEQLDSLLEYAVTTQRQQLAAASEAKRSGGEAEKREEDVAKVLQEAFEKFRESDFDEDLVAPLKALRSAAERAVASDKRVKELEAKLAEFERRFEEVSGYVERNRRGEVERAIDALFEELGDPELFGEGPAASLKVNGPEHTRRLAVFRLADELKRENPSWSDIKCMRQARDRLFGSGRSSVGSKGSESDEDSEGGIVAKWKASSLAPPTKRRPGDSEDSRDPDAAAKRGLKAFEKKTGIKFDW